MRGAYVRGLFVAALPVLALASPRGLGAEEDPVALINWAAPPYWSAPAQEKPVDAAHTKRLTVVNPSLAFHAVTPCRIADTRGNGFTGAYGPPSLVAGTTRAFAVTSPGTSCGIPSGVAAVSFNFAVTTLTSSGNLVAWPTGLATPTVSSLNWTPSEIAISNAAVIALGSNSINVLVNGPGGSMADLIIDVNGYYSADSVVTSLNGVSGAVTLLPGTGVTVTPGAGTVTIGTNATSANTASTIVQRDASGNFAAGTITGTLAGTASGFSGTLAGDVTGTQGATVVGTVGGSSAASLHAAEVLANAATSANTANALVRRDGAGSIAVGVISAAGYQQPGTGGEILKTIRGLFRGSDAAIFAGTGYSVARFGVGVYTITFTTPFSTYPSFTANVVDPGIGNVVFTSYGATGITFTTVDTTGTPRDFQYFSFIATSTP